MIIGVVFDCPFKDNCFRRTAKELCEEKMRVPVMFGDGKWVGAQLFCDMKPTYLDVRRALLKAAVPYRGWRLKEKPEEKRR